MTANPNFQATVLGYYQDFGRFNLPWRQPSPDGTFDAYHIMVSELMLQQTQVARVIPKYAEFLSAFPNVQDLAAAPLGDVLRLWSGLGYNRRAKFLHQAAQAIVVDHAGTVPSTLEALVALPGIGVNTASAILAYAYNQPVVFVETNIRTVYIHHFFADQTGISDKQILELVHDTLWTEDPRSWYWALMDYGSFLKQSVGNVNVASKSYTRQSTFAGSRRQVRGAVIRALTNGPLTEAELAAELPDERLASVLTELTQEGLITQTQKGYSL